MRYLVDTSALVRIWREQVEPDWQDARVRGLITLCEPVLSETLTGVDARRYAEVEEEFRDLVVAATAVRLKLTVPHEDGDFETVARFVPEVR